MKKTVILFLLSVSIAPTYSQTKEELSQQIQSLEMEKVLHQQEIEKLDLEIQGLQYEIDKLTLSENSSFLASNKYTSVVYDTLGFGKSEIFRMPQNEEFFVIDEIQGYYRIYYKNRVGYTLASGIEFENEGVATAFENRRIAKVSRTRENEIENNEELFEEQAELRRAELLEQSRLEAESRQARLKELTDKYGSDDGIRIWDGQIWIGMTKAMLIDSWGYPNDINRSTGSWGVHEQCIYGGTYVYVENGKVTSWQD